MGSMIQRPSVILSMEVGTKKKKYSTSQNELKNTEAEILTEKVNLRRGTT